MTESIFTIDTGVDDGAGRTSGTTYSNSNTYLELGNYFGNAFRSYFRFDNIDIPSTAVIDSCVLRLVAFDNRSGTTVNLKLHFEDADDPSYPTDGTDLISRSLTTGTSWSGVASWTGGNSYDSVDFASELQDVIDRGGWNSNQAVIVHVVDNSSSTSAARLAASYNHATYEPPKLIVNWSVPYAPSINENITITEDISLKSDLVKQENIELSESVELLLGFDETLPTITQDITLSESITMIRGLSGLPTKYENIEISESITALLGFDESLPEQIENITLSEYAYVDTSPTITVFESITISDTGNIRPEPFTSESIEISESVTTRRGYDVDIDDNFVVSDNFVIFNYSDWLRKYATEGKQRFYFTLTGAADNTTDIIIPASSVYARKRSGDPTYLQVTIPSFNYSVEIASRSSGEMQVEMGYEVDGEIALREQILVADLEEINTYEGPLNRSIVLTGHKTISFGAQLVTLNSALVIYRGYQTRARSFRFAYVDPFLNPGDTAVIGNESMTVNNIVYTINPTRTVMEIREAV